MMYIEEGSRYVDVREHAEGARDASKVAVEAGRNCALAAERREKRVAAAWANVALSASVAAVAHAEEAIAEAPHTRDADTAVQWSWVAADAALKAGALVIA